MAYWIAPLPAPIATTADILRLCYTSEAGQHLLERCKGLLEINKDLGRQLSNERMKQLDTELTLQNTYHEQLKASRRELIEFVAQLDQQLEASQATVMAFRSKLARIART